MFTAGYTATVIRRIERAKNTHNTLHPGESGHLDGVPFPRCARMNESRGCFDLYSQTYKHSGEFLLFSLSVRQKQKNNQKKNDA